MPDEKGTCLFPEQATMPLGAAGMNWPPTSLYSRIPSPIEVEGGLLFHPDNWSEAEACMKRMQENGHDVQIWTEPRDLGVFVEVWR